MTISVMLVAAGLTCVLAAILTPLLAKWAHRRDFLDIPNHRSSHVVATPRIGGVALVCAMVAGVALWQAIGMSLGRDAAIVLVGAVAIAALGLADDVWSLSALVRLLVQFVIAAIVVRWTGWLAADPIASIVVTLIVVRSAWRLVRESVDVLLESTPAHISLGRVRDGLQAIVGIESVHDLHVWTVTSGMVAMSAHAVVREPTENQKVLEAAVAAMQRLGISHVTLQVERDSICEAPCP